MVIPGIAADPVLRGLIERLAVPKPGVVHVSGMWGSSAPMVAGLVSAASERIQLYVTAHLEEADNARDDIELFTGCATDVPAGGGDSSDGGPGPRCEIFPAWETLPGEGAGAGEIQAERLRPCAARGVPTEGVVPTAVVVPTA